MREIEKTKSRTSATGRNLAESDSRADFVSRGRDTLSRHRDPSQGIKHSSQDFV
jgi:hypothetical protein